MENELQADKRIWASGFSRSIENSCRNKGQAGELQNQHAADQFSVYTWDQRQSLGHDGTEGKLIL